MRITQLTLAALLGATNAMKIDEACVPQVATAIDQNQFPHSATQQQRDILEWHNKARMDPKSLLPELNLMLTRFGTGSKSRYYSVPGEITMVTQEGAAAVQDAIDYINKLTTTSPEMKWSQPLMFAAKDLAVAQGKTSQTGHTGPNGSTMSSRIDAQGTWGRTIGENVAYGTTGGKDLVLQLFIDDGVRSRGHRANIMKPEFLSLGTWSSTHQTYRNETVFDYAGSMKSNNATPLIPNYVCVDGKESTKSPAGSTPAAATPTTAGGAATPAAAKPAATAPTAAGGATTPAAAKPTSDSSSSNTTTGTMTRQVTSTSCINGVCTTTTSTKQVPRKPCPYSKTTKEITPAAINPQTNKAPESEQYAKIITYANEMFESCDADKNSKLSWREFATCLRAIRREYKKPIIEELRWKMRHINKVGMTVYRGARKYGWENKRRGVTMENIVGFLNENWDKVEPIMNEQYEQR